MIFWICIALVVIATVGGAWQGYQNWYGGASEAFLYGLLWMLGSAVGAALLLVGSYFLLPNPDVQRDAGKLALRSIGTDSEINGRSYFLGGGYIGEERTLNYIAEYPDGALSVDSSYAVSSSIYETNGIPHVEFTDHLYSNPWVLPWEYKEWQESRFYIPEGSVLENYQITN
jgi:hypothetical protein